MFGTLKGRLLIMAAIVIATAAVLLTKGITLGLDLRGGMYLALEVQDSADTMTPEVKREHTQQAEEILRNRLDEFGTVDPTVQRVGDFRIIVELPGVDDMDRARSIIERQAHLEWQLVRDLALLTPALPRMDRAVIAAGGAVDEPAPTADTTTGTQRDVRDLIFRRDTTAADSAAADTAGVQADTADAAPRTQPLSSLLEAAQPGEFIVAEADVERVKGYLALPGVLDQLPRGTELVWSAKPEAAGAQLYRSLYLLDREPFIEGSQLENAVASRDPQYGETIVQFDLDRAGGREFERITGANVGGRIAIVLDGVVHSAPSVRQRIGASGVIQMGQSPMEEARDLALVLRAGAFTAPVQVEEMRQIGPSLGRDSIDQGRMAGIIGIVLVIVIMMLYYRIAGVMAVAALCIYIMLLLGGLAAFGATLTAPGIAGIILSLGMAVDANVLIFERIREELALGRTVRAAVDNGFQHAMSAIVDSNITTLITALILFQVGTGPVRGFAVTLSIGIVASFFSAVFITRTFFMLYLDRRRTADALSI
ncbi:MAG TPA: protein translocase subunit SecD [Longimicrobiales bacterium]|nr:protein translocase subunit SecD [Longimicrobiales bacterium]